MTHPDRLYDIVVLGATGYTGTFVAEYIALTLPTNIRWAIAGRTSVKLSQASIGLEELHPDRTQPGTHLTSHVQQIVCANFDRH
jgi:short subunit dehydrogenase-like uncharacterized protein